MSIGPTLPKVTIGPVDRGGDIGYIPEPGHNLAHCERGPLLHRLDLQSYSVWDRVFPCEPGSDGALIDTEDSGDVALPQPEPLRDDAQLGGRHPLILWECVGHSTPASVSTAAAAAISSLWRFTHRRVMLVCPSFTDTDIDRRAIAGDGGPAALSKATVGRLATPYEIGAAIVEGVRRGRRRVLPTSLSRSAWWLSRLAPETYARVMLTKQGPEFGIGPRPS